MYRWKNENRTRQKFGKPGMNLDMPSVPWCLGRGTGVRACRKQNKMIMCENGETGRRHIHAKTEKERQQQQQQQQQEQQINQLPSST